MALPGPLLCSGGAGGGRGRGVCFAELRVRGAWPSGAGAARRWRRARQTFQRCFYSCCRKQRESLGAAAARGARRVQGGTKFPGFHAMRSRRVTRRAIRLVPG